MVDPAAPSPEPDAAPYAGTGAVVLTGGTGSRLGGADKAALLLGDETLLSRALGATARAVEVVVVGVPAPTTRPVLWTREEPPGGGPAAGLLAGVDRLSPGCDLVAVLAVDMPRVTPETFARLVAALHRGGAAYDGALLVDGTGHRQPLCAVYRRGALATALPTAQPTARPTGRPDHGAAHGLSMRRLVAGLRLAEVPAEGAEASDVDTWEDLARLGSRPGEDDGTGGC